MRRVKKVVETKLNKCTPFAAFVSGGFSSEFWSLPAPSKMNKDRSSTTPADLMLKCRGKRSKVSIYTFDIVQYFVYVFWSIEYQTQPLTWDAIIIKSHSDCHQTFNFQNHDCKSALYVTLLWNVEQYIVTSLIIIGRYQCLYSLDPWHIAIIPAPAQAKT